MGAKKPRILIIGAGMAGLTAANKLYTTAKDEFEVVVVEGGTRIGGRINTSEFGGDRIEMGATWIHGIEGSPVYEIATQIGALDSDQPWECMDGSVEFLRTVAEDGSEVNPAIVERISALFKSLMDFAQGKMIQDGASEEAKVYHEIAAEALKACKDENGGLRSQSIGSFLRKGIEVYWGSNEGGNWRRKSVEEAIFAMHENTQRTYTSAGDLSNLDFSAESEYVMCGGEEITIAKGYCSIIQSLASILPPGTIRLGRKVTNIEWQRHPQMEISENGHSYSCPRPVKLHFHDGSTVTADHVIVTVSLGVLKARTGPDSGGLFSPPLPSFKTDAISRLGFGVVNKLFLQLAPANDWAGQGHSEFPFLQMAFHPPDSELKNDAVPWWIRRTAYLGPIYRNSDVLLSWFAGKEALQLESLTDEEIIDGVSTTVNRMLFSNPESCNGKASPKESPSLNTVGVKFQKVLRSKWASNPLFLGSYSHVAVGSSGDDLDALAEPLPREFTGEMGNPQFPLQILFAGEATHRTHYSTTHGAYFSGIREANRLLKHYRCV